ncbi:MAG: nuclear transport factor 2 family protein [Actinomycetota bacterium]
MGGRRAMLAFASALVLTACGGAAAGVDRAREGEDRPGVAGIYQLQADVHRSGTSKDLDLLMSRWTEGARLEVAGRTYTGKAEIRRFFATAHPAFKPDNHWVALTRSPNIRVAAQGDRGTLYFECYFVDAATKQVAAATSAETKVVRESGRWLLEEYLSGSVELAP